MVNIIYLLVSAICFIGMIVFLCVFFVVLPNQARTKQEALERKISALLQSLPVHLGEEFTATSTIQINRLISCQKIHPFLPQVIISLDSLHKKLAVTTLVPVSPTNGEDYTLKTDYIAFHDIIGGQILSTGQSVQNTNFSFLFGGGTSTTRISSIKELYYVIQLRSLDNPTYEINFFSWKGNLGANTPSAIQYTRNAAQLDSIIQKIAEENKFATV